MSTEIKAIFETPDNADFALMRLRDAGIQPETLNIQPLRQSKGDDIPGYTLGTHTWFANMLTPISWSAYGGRGDENITGERGRDVKDSGVKQDVVLNMMVPPQNVSDTMHILVNAGGRSIHTS